METLFRDVRTGRIGLPDLQRPFVWKDNKVRELLDSMMKGYPIGYIMLWSSPEEYDNTGYIGKNDKIYNRPDDLVIDGQQRLTALLASFISTIKVDSPLTKSSLAPIRVNILSNIGILASLQGTKLPS